MLRHPHAADADADIRALLDQRQPRFSAVSDYSDTPSVYSRPYFSPHPPHDADYDYPSPVDDHPPHQSPSMLDLDDDPRASYASTYDDEPNPYEPRDDTSAGARLSYLGPKMRFHSRAPWELDDGDLDEEDEPEESPRHFGASFPFARRRPSGSSSPRPSFQTTRPSGESSRSQVLPKRSFETTSSQISYPRGALYALAQESMSASSLARVAHQPKEILRSKFSLGRLRPGTPTGPLPPPPVPPIFPAHSRFPPSSPTYERPNEVQFPPAYESMHPYANPDLVVSYANDDTSNYHSSLGSHYPSSRNHSNLTVTEAYSSDSLAKSSSQATLTPDTSISSITSKPRSSAILAKNISSPVPVINPPDLSASDRNEDHSALGLPPGVSNLAGWTERNTVPSFSLISLEEARAQRLRSATTSNEASRASSSSGSRASAAFPAEENETPNTSQGSDGSPFANIPSRARGRSVSAGSKAKTALQTIVGQSKSERREPESAQLASSGMATATGGRSLKHKKSGFMRLFNGGKVQEKDERDDPPPVPSLPEQHVGSSGSGNTYQAQQRAKPVQRIPVPSLSPSLYETVSVPSSDSVASETPSWKGGLLSPRRTPPVLSIRTISSVSGPPSARASVSAVVDTRGDNSDTGYANPLAAAGETSTARRPWATAESQPQSAPAHVSEFPALRLRPISTLFSAHFSDHIVPIDGEPRSAGSETNDSGTPRSAASPMPPLTPPASALSITDIGGDGKKSEIRVNESSATEQQQLAVSARTAAWQQQIWELEGQVRDLKAELEAANGRYSDEYCSHCGRGKKAQTTLSSAPVGGSIINRPRARTGTSSRFGKALP